MVGSVSGLLNVMPSELGTDSAAGGRYFGVYPAVVRDIVDPDGQGRVKVRLPWSPDAGADFYEVWARLATMMAGPGRGSWFIPDVDDEVLVSFEGGNPKRPYVVGALWNGVDTPPETMDSAGENNIKSLTSRNGVKVTLDDSNGQESLILETPGGQRLVLQDGPGSIELRDSNGNTIRMAPNGITISSGAKVTINAATVEVSAGMVSVNSGMSRFSGVVQTPTLVATTVVGTSYTPGVGNIW